MQLQKNENYANAFRSYLRYGYQGMDSHERRAMTIGSSTSGEALTSTSFQDVVYSVLAGENCLRKLCTVFNAPSKVHVPYNTSNASVETRDEGNTWNAVGSTSTFFETTGYKIGSRVSASIEMVEDYPELESYIATVAGMEIGKQEEAYCWTGSGSGQPKGILSETIANTVTESDMSGSALYDMLQFDAFTPYNIPKNLAFVINAFSMAKTFTQSNANEENWSPAIDADAYYGYLPAYATSSLQKSGVSDNIWASVGNWKVAFIICDIGDVRIFRDNESEADKGIVNFYVYKRFDCKLINANAMALVKKS